MLSRFWLLWGWGFGWIRWKSKICGKNLFQIMLNEVLKSRKKNDICSYKNWCETRNKRTSSCILYLFTEVTSQNLKYIVKQACIFNLILIGIPSSLILSVKNRGWRVFYLMTKICQALWKLFVEDPLVAGFFHLNSKFISKSSFPLQRCKNVM